MGACKVSIGKAGVFSTMLVFEETDSDCSRRFGGLGAGEGPRVWLGYIHLSIQQIFTEDLLCIGHSSRSS